MAEKKVKKDEVLLEGNVEKTENTESTKATKAASEEKKKKKAKLTKDMSIKIISNVDGSLFYQSPNKMVTIEIDEFGGYDYVELSTLIAMRNSNKKFFTENWIVVDDGEDYTASDIYEFLRVSEFYNNIYKPYEVDKLLALSPSKIKEILSNYSSSLKQTIFYIAKSKFEKGLLDSVQLKNAIEQAVGMSFDE